MSEGVLSAVNVDNVDRLSAPTEGVPSAVQKSHSQWQHMNQRPKISDSRLAVKWTAAKCIMNAEQYRDFSDDVSMESCQLSEPNKKRSLYVAHVHNFHGFNNFRAP